MKTFVFKLLLIGTLSIPMVFLSGCESKTVLTQTNTPEEITSFVKSNFPEYRLLQTVRERDGLHIKYKLILDRGLSLEFDRKKEIVEIDGREPLPDKVLPVKINQYLSTNFPSNPVTEWELDDRHQKVGLENGMDLIFDLKGDFVRIED